MLTYFFNFYVHINPILYGGDAVFRCVDLLLKWMEESAPLIEYKRTDGGIGKFTLCPVMVLIIINYSLVIDGLQYLPFQLQINSFLPSLFFATNFTSSTSIYNFFSVDTLIIMY